jgi:catechol 2,3-dioxygenase-like lactoylglutathione lyase family enzyme
MDMKLEVLLLPVSDVDRTKRFYEKLGFRLDLDVANEDFRGIQFTPLQARRRRSPSVRGSLPPSRAQ